MMQLFNYIGLGYNYANGAADTAKLSPSQIKRRVVDRPSYLTYLGYVNFMPACLVGPVYEYADFDQYFNRTGDFVNIPSPLKAVMNELGTFIFSVALYGITSVFPLERIVEAEYTTYGIAYKLFYCVMAITHVELKYVSAWSLGMISMKASGFTYNPEANKKNDQSG